MLSIVSTALPPSTTLRLSDGDRVQIEDLHKDHPIMKKVDAGMVFELGKLSAWHQANQLLTAKDRQIQAYQERLKTAGFTAVA